MLAGAGAIGAWFGICDGVGRLPGVGITVTSSVEATRPGATWPVVLR